MKNLINKIFKRKLTTEQLAIIQLNEGLKILQDHIIAVSRLHFIKPETLIREAENIKENTEYLKKLIEIRQNEKETK